MTSVLPYIIKVIIISAILHGYYYLALRNKTYHHYNRFYLLASIALSVLLPLVQLNFSGTAASNSMVIFLQTDLIAEAPVVQKSSVFLWSRQLILAAAYLLIVTALIILFIVSLIRLYRVRKNGIKIFYKDHTLVKTRVGGTPFSFFRNIFWDVRTPVDSLDGERMMKHELVHVKQNHSLDKLIVNLVQIFFWFNPVFWMVKRELNIIHEFLADKESFSEEHLGQFSRMALEAAYPGYGWPANNNFFSSNLKRRIMMILKNNRNNRIGYFGRLMVLPLGFLIVLFFSMKANAKIEPVGYGVLSPVTEMVQPDIHPLNEMVVVAEQPRDKPKVKKEGTQLINDKTEAGDTLPERVIIVHGKQTKGATLSVDADSVSKPLYILNGKKITYEETSRINPSQIKSISVLKGEEAVKIFGSEGKSGVVEISLKTPEEINSGKITEEKQLKGATHSLGVVPSSEALYFVNGKRITYEEMTRISPSDIKSVLVLKDKPAVKKYGLEAERGVVEITLKTTDEVNSEVIVRDAKEGSSIGTALNKNIPDVDADANVLYLIDGKKATKNELHNLNTQMIQSVNVIKGEKAFEKYGEEGKDGVVEVFTKSSGNK